MSSDLEHSLGVLLWKASNLWQRKVTEALKPLDLTHVQSLMLSGIERLQQEGMVVTQNKLAQSLQLDVMMTSKVCRTLQKKGMILRANNRLDTRAKSLVMTKLGKELLSQAFVSIEQVGDELFSEVGPEQQKVLKSLVSGYNAATS